MNNLIGLRLSVYLAIIATAFAIIGKLYAMQTLFGIPGYDVLLMAVALSLITAFCFARFNSPAISLKFEWLRLMAVAAPAFIAPILYYALSPLHITSIIHLPTIVLVALILICSLLYPFMFLTFLEIASKWTKDGQMLLSYLNNPHENNIKNQFITSCYAINADCQKVLLSYLPNAIKNNKTDQLKDLCSALNVDPEKLLLSYLPVAIQNNTTDQLTTLTKALNVDPQTLLLNHLPVAIQNNTTDQLTTLTKALNVDPQTLLLNHLPSAIQNNTTDQLKDLCSALNVDPEKLLLSYLPVAIQNNTTDQLTTLTKALNVDPQTLLLNHLPVAIQNNTTDQLTTLTKALNVDPQTLLLNHLPSAIQNNTTDQLPKLCTTLNVKLEEIVTECAVNNDVTGLESTLKLLTTKQKQKFFEIYRDYGNSFLNQYLRCFAGKAEINDEIIKLMISQGYEGDNWNTLQNMHGSALAQYITKQCGNKTDLSEEMIQLLQGKEKTMAAFNNPKDIEKTPLCAYLNLCPNVTLDMVKRLGGNLPTVRTMSKEIKSTAEELKKDGYTAAELVSAEFHLDSLKQAKFPSEEITAALENAKKKNGSAKKETGCKTGQTPITGHTVPIFYYFTPVSYYLENSHLDDKQDQPKTLPNLEIIRLLVQNYTTAQRFYCQNLAKHFYPNNTELLKAIQYRSAAPQTKQPVPTNPAPHSQKNQSSILPPSAPNSASNPSQQKKALPPIASDSLRTSNMNRAAAPQNTPHALNPTLGGKQVSVH